MLRGGVAGDAAQRSKPFERRTFLRGVAGVGVGAVVLGSSNAADADTELVGYPHVWRLSTRGMVVCNACKGNGAHRYYRRSRFANHGRAHHGCNCRIVVQRISKRLWKQYFVKPDGSLRRVWDDRW